MCPVGAMIVLAGCKGNHRRRFSMTAPQSIAFPKTERARAVSPGVKQRCPPAGQALAGSAAVSFSALRVMNAYLPMPMKEI